MKRKNGFTTLELMVTIGIIAILTAMAVPSYIQWLPGYRLRSAASDVHSAMQMARLRAVRENGGIGVSFVDGEGKNGKFRVFVDNNNNNNFDANDRTIKYGEMPGSVRMVADMPQAIFNGRGLVITGVGTVRLRSSTGSTKNIQLIITGSARIL